jgi:hypothetical protein
VEVRRQPIERLDIIRRAAHLAFLYRRLATVTFHTRLEHHHPPNTCVFADLISRELVKRRNILCLEPLARIGLL